MNSSDFASHEQATAVVRQIVAPASPMNSFLCLAKTLVPAPPTANLPCENVTKPLRILVILKSAGVLANDRRRW